MGGHVGGDGTRFVDGGARDNPGAMDSVVAIDARDGYAPQLRGWGRYARCLVEALQADPPLGLRIDALSEGGSGPEVVFEQLRLPLLLRRRRAALIHATNCFLPLVRPCPGVVTINDLAFEAWPSDFVFRTRSKYRVLARAAAHSAELVICPSSYTRDDVCARYGVDPARVRVIPDAPALPVLGEEAGEGRYVLAVGDLREKKNLSALVRAFVSLRRRAGIPHRLVLAGVDAGAGAALRGLGAGEDVELTGYVSDARLDALIRGAELLVHPSLYEGFGLVILEAMVRGTPVLAARATALPETGGDAAAYFEPSDPDDLERTLGALLDDASARRELADRGLAHAARFSWKRTARETAAVYRELV
jgi:glycosyltransferase involved in cell wall biosynthesis